MALSARLRRAIAVRTARLSPRMQRAWLTALRDLRATMVSEVKLARMIEMGRIDALITPELLDKSFAPLRREVIKSVKVGWEGTVSGTGVEVAFSTASPRVLSAIRTLDAKLLKPMSDGVRETVRQAVEAGLREGQGPLEVARGLRSVIGLAPNQEEAVRNFRKALDAGDISKALGYKLRDKRFDSVVRKGQLTPEKVDQMVGAYRRKFEAWHAETVSRTATLNAYRAGADASARDAMDKGILDRDRTQKVWVTVGDDRVRDEHVAMEGETVGVDESFSNGLMYPEEYNCRCQVEYILTPLG